MEAHGVVLYIFAEVLQGGDDDFAVVEAEGGRWLMSNHCILRVRVEVCRLW